MKNYIVWLIISLLFISSNNVLGLDNPVWIDNNIAMTDDVLDPWQKIEINKNIVKLTGRDYEISNEALMSNISINGNKILQDPIKIKLKVNNEWVDFSPAKFQFETIKNNKVIVKSEYNSKSFKTITRTNIEYDGFTQVDFTITPIANLTINDCHIEIPLKKEFVSLFTHHYLEKPPYDINSINKETDFKGGALPDEGWFGPFSPAIWLGNESVGIQWFSESMEGWSISNRDRVIEIKRSGDTVSLFVHIIGKNYSPQKEITFKFGVIATPVKPFPSFQQYSTFSTAQAASAAMALRWLSPDDLDKAVQKGLKIIVIHQMWTELQGYPGTFENRNAKPLKRFIQEAHNRNLKVIVYIGNMLSMAAPEWPNYGEKMVIEPKRDSKKRDAPPARSVLVDANRFFSDFLVYNIQQMIREYDIDGVMLDGTGMIFPCENKRHGHGVTDSDGNNHPTYPIAETRDLLRRLYHLFHMSPKRDGIILAHVGSPFVPSLSFCDFRWAGEATLRRYRKGYFGWLASLPLGGVSLDEFRASYMGYQYGIPTIYMTKADKSPVSANETAALALLHGVMPRFNWLDFADKKDPNALEHYKVWKMRKDFGLDGSVFYPYWGTQPGVSIEQPDKAKVSFYKKPDGSMLLFIMNMSDNDETINVKFDLGVLGVQARKFQYDTVSGKHGMLSNSSLPVSIKAKSYEVVLVY
ncbi:glycoside hydrolase domain-containing protein [Desulforhabdus amnigena]|jgi:hypothetical protein|uniref:Glycoside hydrolase 123-like N-terminal domain-containing protein n=1 Tax=Desulforhabdus amnigena TaxID=40218 RepID=A0A9W6FRV9_9BACT|nr:glycoside hydrolase domain-containing protein [Desulforhabdus amnigena]GLI33409.1 hypothetical protein DAMNIGENAA_08420 [Desulforhabdus amnigena]